MGSCAETLCRRPRGATFVRVLAVGMVGWFHIWQQSWVGAGRLDILPRTGSVWVDMMILLSGFCLALPYGTDRAMGKGFRGTGGFYTKRAVRILPAFYFCAAVHLGVSLVQSGPAPGLWKDVLGHLTLTHTLSSRAYHFTQMGGALWTVSVLGMFYLLFPLLIRGFFKCPAGMMAAMLAVQAGYGIWALGLEGYSYQMAFNQLPAFAGVLAIGMGAALLYPMLALRIQGRYKPLFLAGAAGSFVLIMWYLRSRFVGGEGLIRAQLVYRLPLALLFALLLIFCCLGFGEDRKKGILSVLSAISYSFYLWHQSIAVWLKELRIPHWEGETPPNQLGDTVWMHRYNLLCWAAALLAAAAGYYLLEKPVTNWLLSRKKPQNTEKTRGLPQKDGKTEQKSHKTPAGLA